MKALIASLLLAVSVAAIAQPPLQPKRVALYVSTNNGATWAPALAGSGTAVPLPPDAVIVTCSPDNGATWNFNCTFGGGGGDSISSPNTTISVGGSSASTTLDLNMASPNTWTATQTFSATTAKFINGVGQAVNYPGATVAEQVNQCIIDAETKTNGNTTGVCDARGLAGTFTTDEQITCGDTNDDPVTLLLPRYGNWGLNTTGGTAYTILQYPWCNLDGDSQPSATFTFSNRSAANGIYAVYGIAQPSTSNNYYYAYGFTVANRANQGGHPTASGYAAIIAGTSFGVYDTSTWSHLYFDDDQDVSAISPFPTAGPLLVAGLCCQAVIEHIEVNARYTAGETPVTFLNLTGTTQKMPGLAINDSTFGHSGTGLPLISVIDTTAGQAMVLSFSNIYGETANGSGTCVVNVNGGGTVSFKGTTTWVAETNNNLVTDGFCRTTQNPNTHLVVDTGQFLGGGGTFTYPQQFITDANSTATPPATDATGHFGGYDSFPLAANTVMAGPASGSAGAAAARALVIADIPTGVSGAVLPILNAAGPTIFTGSLESAGFIPTGGGSLHNTTQANGSFNPQSTGPQVNTGVATNTPISNNTLGSTVPLWFFENIGVEQSGVGPLGNYEVKVGAAVASAATITPTGAIFHVTGTTAISTMNIPVGMSPTIGGCLQLIADGAWTITANTGLQQFKNNFTATAGQRVEFCYDGGLWY